MFHYKMLGRNNVAIKIRNERKGRFKETINSEPTREAIEKFRETEKKLVDIKMIRYAILSTAFNQALGNIFPYNLKTFEIYYAEDHEADNKFSIYIVNKVDGKVYIVNKVLNVDNEETAKQMCTALTDRIEEETERMIRENNKTFSTNN